MAKQDKTIEYVGDSRVPAKRTPNVSPSYSEFPGKNEPFWPNFLLKEWMVAAVALVAYLILTVSHPSPLTDKADPTNTDFTPLPDWYFLFLFQLLKFPWASGDWVLIGILVIPGLMFGGLLLAPFLDRGPERRWTKRPVSSGLMFIGIISIVYLTWAAMDEHHRLHPPKEESAGHETPADPKPSASTEDPGAAVWAKQMNCQGCHGVDMSGGAGPALTAVGGHLSADEIKEVIVNGRGTMPGKLFSGSDQELDQLVEYLAGLK
ncbi:menaquinol-cytochrome c reductase cytochrome b/c subunit [Ammoniphilus sp. CFH 90114]|uniref:menaquinol-cytochrome c reductase cytochrome b/c subunit n=1 Tax=Ammoniphilus sp. CFH 90114 TaxID=2493665 RepID=UPI00100E3F03|nr:menaquinol-cytochrome c reductase cytochrome b/c subunit [Ammoniphilus sp. CFH 90114]RXT13932.1 c-type cytochrome [Ammoniphilus sp. CFH 90114]